MGDTMPPLVLPPPAPQNEAEGVQRGKDTPEFSPAPNPVTGAVGGEKRLHPDAVRHPVTKKFQSKY
jgi:hypothetical protein